LLAVLAAKSERLTDYLRGAYLRNRDVDHQAADVRWAGSPPRPGRLGPAWRCRLDRL